MSRTRNTIALFMVALFLIPTLFITNTALAANINVNVYRAGYNSITVYYTQLATGTATYTVTANSITGGSQISETSTTGSATLYGLMPNVQYIVTVSRAIDSGTSQAFTLDSLGYNWNYNYRYGYGYGYPYYNYLDPNAAYVGITPSTASYYGSGEVSFTLKAAPHTLNRVGVDRQLLTEGTHYTISRASGSSTRTTVTLRQSFLNSLSLGYHEITFSFASGSTTATLHVERRGSTGSTGSSSTGASVYDDYVEGSGKLLRNATVYGRADGGGDKLGSFRKGASVNVIGFSPTGAFAIVQFGAEEGYVRADYVSVAVGGMIGRTTQKASMYIRKSTSSKYEYADVNGGTEFELLAREGEYWLVSFNGESLYIRAKYVRIAD